MRLDAVAGGRDVNDSIKNRRHRCADERAACVFFLAEDLPRSRHVAEHRHAQLRRFVGHGP